MEEKTLETTKETKKVNKTKIIIAAAAVFVVAVVGVVVAIVAGNQDSIVGKWAFVNCEETNGEYYDSPEERKAETIVEIEFYKDGDFEAVLGEKKYTGYRTWDKYTYSEETIRGEYEIEDDELILFYGYDDELRFEFEKKGKKLYLEDDRRTDYLYEKK